MHRPAVFKKENTSQRASDPLFNLKTAAAVAQALLESGLDHALLLASSQYVTLAALLAYNLYFYTQKKDTSLLSGISRMRNYPIRLSVSISSIG
jgi:hypothetical protein